MKSNDYLILKRLQRLLLICKLLKNYKSFSKEKVKNHYFAFLSITKKLNEKLILNNQGYFKLSNKTLKKIKRKTIKSLVILSEKDKTAFQVLDEIDNYVKV